MIRAQEILLIKQERTTPVAFVPSGELFTCYYDKIDITF